MLTAEPAHVVGDPEARASGCTASTSVAAYVDGGQGDDPRGPGRRDPLPDPADHAPRTTSALRPRRRLFAELGCPKTLLRFTAAEGAGDHCEMANRSLANLRMLDWLAATLDLDR